MLYSVHEKLRYLNSQKRLNARHSKWVEFLQDYTFVLKHKACVENKVANALSRRVMILIIMSAEVIGFERLREEYDSCPDFGKFMSRYRTTLFVKWTVFYYKTVSYSESVSYVFRARPSEILSWEIHAGGLAVHFGQNKIIEVVEHRFYWPSLKKDVAKIVSQWRTCQLAEQQKQIVGPYTPLPVPNSRDKT